MSRDGVKSLDELYGNKVFWGWTPTEICQLLFVGTRKQISLRTHGTPKQRKKWDNALRRKARLHIKRRSIAFTASGGRLNDRRGNQG